MSGIEKLFTIQFNGRAEFKTKQKRFLSIPRGKMKKIISQMLCVSRGVFEKEKKKKKTVRNLNLVVPIAVFSIFSRSSLTKTPELSQKHVWMRSVR